MVPLLRRTGRSPDRKMAKADDEKTRSAVSVREYLDKDGNVLEGLLGAAAARYMIKRSGWAITMKPAELPEEVQGALACFALHTLAGNVSSAARNSAEAKALTPSQQDADQRATIEAWFDNLKQGNWSVGGDRTEAGLASLAEAFVRVRRKLGDESMSVEAALEKLRASEPTTVKAIRANAKVQEALAEIQLERKRALAREAADAAPMPEL